MNGKPLFSHGQAMAPAALFVPGKSLFLEKMILLAPFPMWQRNGTPRKMTLSPLKQSLPTQIEKLGGNVRLGMNILRGLLTGQVENMGALIVQEKGFCKDSMTWPHENQWLQISGILH
jgi:hypothetical protein